MESEARQSMHSEGMDCHASLNGMDAPASYRHLCAKVWGVFNNPLKREGASTMKVTTIGLDLAKDVFQICAADANGKILYNKQLRRHQMAEFFTKLPACLIGVEACGSAHYWARKLLAMGHEVKLMPPQYV